MILMPQIFDVTANENARYKRNELECVHTELLFLFHVKYFSRSEVYYSIIHTDLQNKRYNTDAICFIVKTKNSNCHT